MMHIPWVIGLLIPHELEALSLISVTYSLAVSRRRRRRLAEFPSIHPDVHTHHHVLWCIM